MSRNESKFGKKKSGNKFSREKNYADSEADILLANQNQEIYKEERTKERHERRVEAGLEEDDKDKKEKEKEPILETAVGDCKIYKLSKRVKKEDDNDE
jgi:hypothetical protein